LPIFDPRRRAILRIKVGAFDALIEVIEIGFHEPRPIAPDGFYEVRQGRSEASHHKAGSLISCTPSILPRYSDKAELATRASVDTRAGIELDRVLAVYRQRDGQARAHVLLLIVAFDAVYGGA
jgi:hypothetical protein